MLASPLDGHIGEGKRPRCCKGGYWARASIREHAAQGDRPHSRRLRWCSHPEHEALERAVVGSCWLRVPCCPGDEGEGAPLLSE